MTELRYSAGAAVALVAVLQGCQCSEPIPTTFFRELAYAPDGRSLILSANDGVYLAHPPSNTPHKATDRECRGPSGLSPSCARSSADGRRIALLTAAGATGGEGSGYDLDEIAVNGAPGIPAEPASEVALSRVAKGVLDAAFSPDGKELVWARAGEAADTIAIEHQGPSGAAELVHAIPLAGGTSGPLETVAIGSWGVAYPRSIAQDVELWYRPFDGRTALSLGILPSSCQGAGFRGCVRSSGDGSTFAWQGKDGGVFHVFLEQKEVDLPLGSGYGFAFSRSGAFMLRMEAMPSASVTRVDTAGVVRRVADAASGELSSDGESIAYLKVESKALGTARLFVGASRNAGRDQDYGAFESPARHPVAPRAMGLLDVEHVFSGDGRFVLVTARGEEAGTAKVIAVNVDTAESKPLASLACDRCCDPSPRGALLVCAPALADAPSGPLGLDLYDLSTGLKTRVADAAVDAQLLADGSGVAVLDYPGKGLPELRVATGDGRVTSLGSALRFAASPTVPELAVISVLGSLSVRALP
jgi:hypothetical protein